MSVAALRSDSPPDVARPVISAPAIEVDDLHRSFGSVEALRGIDLEVAAGEVHALLGPNGAGKTTLMRILSGLVDPSEGSAYVLDRQRRPLAELRALIGMVPPGDRTFYLRLSGLENLVFFARLHGLRRRAARERALELLDAVGLADAAKRPVNAYSHGMQKRLSFARALLGEPGAAARRRGDARPRSRRRAAGPRPHVRARAERGAGGAVGDPADRGAARLRRRA